MNLKHFDWQLQPPNKSWCFDAQAITPRQHRKLEYNMYLTKKDKKTIWGKMCRRAPG